MKKIVFIVLGIALIVLAVITWGKSVSIVDNGVIITNKSNNVVASYQGKKEVTSDSYHPYLIGTNIEDAISLALENAGPGYDMLIDATLKVNYYYMIIYFSNYITVEGTAVNSAELKAEMGEQEYYKWLSSKDILQRNNLKKNE
ncbi:hypothetical protein [Algibacter lectus]|uniref:Uncharacterized protein n=1 Tax=Algibacter lectus TaxID=221126 RepID=A0A090VP46_9FLAO|nr:hypothetical protein [Algibacter lectus]GAL65094.1 hypothetical protein JCM19300_2825 [Algibacter lectus]